MPKYELENNESKLMVSITHTTKYPQKKGLHSHKHYEIMHIKMDKGEMGRFRIKDSEYNFDNNSIIAIPPGVKHITISKPEFTTRTLISVQHDFLQPSATFAHVRLRSLFSHGILNFPSADMHKIQRILNMIYEEYAQFYNMENTPKMRTLFALLLCELSEFSSVASPLNITAATTNDIINYLKRHYSQHITLDLLSNRFGINKFAICRQIKNETGKNFAEILQSIRIDAAKHLLIKSTMNIADIAVATGLTSSNYLAKTFKKRFGVTPIEYRKEHKINKK